MRKNRFVDIMSVAVDNEIVDVHALGVARVREISKARELSRIQIQKKAMLYEDVCCTAIIILT